MKLEVYLYINRADEPVGTIETLPGSGEHFTYAESWLTRENAFPISLSLPLQEEAFTARRMRPYFEGLLPEGRPRGSVAKQLHVSSKSYLRILAGIGWECIGAVSFHGEGNQPAAHYRKLSTNELEEIAVETVRNSTGIQGASRFSLAGAQPKTSLYLSQDEIWYRPEGGAPSTHILKPINGVFGDAALNEALCTLTASIVGFSVPDVSVIQTEVPMICTKRFDRTFEQNGLMIDGLEAPSRLHQEDVCQALGLLPEQKYEESNHRYLRLMADVVRTESSNPIADLRQLWMATIFNYLIGNCDAHLKNFALLRETNYSSLRLAPLYDLLSTDCYEQLSKDMALSLDGCRNLEKVSRADFDAEARAIGLSRQNSDELIEETAEKIIPALEEAVSRLSTEGLDAEEFLEKILPSVMKRRSVLLGGK